MKRIITTISIGIAILFLGNSSIHAQQDPMFTHYMFNLATVNPAAIGRGDFASVMNVNRYQWVGFEGAPKTHSLNADIPLRFFNCGAGLTYLLDRIGPEKTNNFYIDYAYHLKLTETLKVGFGLKAGFRVFSASFNNFTPSGTNDPQFASNIKGKFTPNFGLGVFLYSHNFYVGISSPKVLNHKYVDSYSGGEERHYFLISGYAHEINNNLVFKPSVFLKYVEGAPVSYDFTASFLIRNTFWIGAMFRSGDAVGILTQIQLNNRLHLGYTYDFTFTKIRTVSDGTHELMLTFEFSPNGERIRSPRYF